MTDNTQKKSLAADARINLIWRASAAVRKQAPFLTEQASEAIATAVLEELRATAGGEPVYVPAASKSARNAAIRAAYDGKNRDELCKRHGIGKTAFYDIIGRVKR